ncbi:unnamed protein product [Urochloa humidicola]
MDAPRGVVAVLTEALCLARRSKKHMLPCLLLALIPASLQLFCGGHVSAYSHILGFVARLHSLGREHPVTPRFYDLLVRLKSDAGALTHANAALAAACHGLHRWRLKILQSSQRNARLPPNRGDGEEGRPGGISSAPLHKPPAPRCRLLSLRVGDGVAGPPEKEEPPRDRHRRARRRRGAASSEGEEAGPARKKSSRRRGPAMPRAASPAKPPLELHGRRRRRAGPRPR